MATSSGRCNSTNGPTSPFNPASPLAQSLTNLFVLVLAVLAVILVVVSVLVAWSCWRFRRRSASDPEPAPVAGNLKLEIAWTVVPVLLLSFMSVFMVKVMWAVDVGSEVKRPPDIRVYGHQWWWEARYASGVVTANEIHVPVDRRLLVEVEGADIIHTLWVPQLTRKIETIPGHPNRIWLEASVPGTYLGFCTQFCGLEHAWMQVRVVAQPERDFEAWEAAQRTPAAAPTDPSP